MLYGGTLLCIVLLYFVIMFPSKDSDTPPLPQRKGASQRQGCHGTGYRQLLRRHRGVAERKVVVGKMSILGTPKRPNYIFLSFTLSQTGWKTRTLVIKTGLGVWCDQGAYPGSTGQTLDSHDAVLLLPHGRIYNAKETYCLRYIFYEYYDVSWI